MLGKRSQSNTSLDSLPKIKRHRFRHDAVDISSRQKAWSTRSWQERGEDCLRLAAPEVCLARALLRGNKETAQKYNLAFWLPHEIIISMGAPNDACDLAIYDIAECDSVPKRARSNSRASGELPILSYSGSCCAPAPCVLAVSGLKPH